MHCRGQHVTLEDLQHDILVIIAEKVDPKDRRSLRLVSKRFHAAVGDAAVAVRPHRSITSRQVFLSGILSQETHFQLAIILMLARGKGPVMGR